MNVCHTLILADQSQRSGSPAYFITDGEKPVFKEFNENYVTT
ncbi:hypothetical protein ACWA1F_05205 [Flavobacterium sp. 3-218]